MLIKADADVNLASNDGFTPLYLAAKNGHQDIVKLLIKAGACFSDMANAHKVATKNGSSEIANLLEDKLQEIIKPFESAHPCLSFILQNPLLVAGAVGLVVAIAVFATILTLGGAPLTIVPVVSCIAAGGSAGAFSFFSMPKFYQHVASAHEQPDEIAAPAV